MSRDIFLIIIVRFIMATGTYSEWNDEAYQGLHDWMLEQIDPDVWTQFEANWEDYKFKIPALQIVIREALLTTEHSFIPWHSSDNIVWPLLLKIAQRFPLEWESR